MAASKANYAAFAELLSSTPEDVILRRFRQLSIRNLLAYQAELVHLERQLHLIEDIDAGENPNPADRVNFRWDVPKTKLPNGAPLAAADRPAAVAKPPGDSHDAAEARKAGVPTVSTATLADQYCEKMLEIRETLTRYYEALEQFGQQQALPTPADVEIRAMARWLNTRGLGNGFLEGSFEDVWSGAQSPDDFLTFSEQRGLTGRIARGLILLMGTVQRSPTAKVYTLKATDEGGLARLIAVIVCSTLPVLPIIILFFIHSLLLRIGLIMAFNAVFAVILVFGLRFPAERALAITTAIAAIQVVYVGGTSTDGSTSQR